jgi:hypothetical protein
MAVEYSFSHKQRLTSHLPAKFTSSHSISRLWWYARVLGFSGNRGVANTSRYGLKAKHDVLMLDVLCAFLNECVSKQLCDCYLLSCGNCVQLVCIEISSIVPCITNVTCHRASSSWVQGGRFVDCKTFASESVAVTRIGHISQLPGWLAGRVKSGV